MMVFCDCFFLWACDWLQSAGGYLWSPAHEYDDVKLLEYTIVALYEIPLNCVYIE